MNPLGGIGGEMIAEVKRYADLWADMAFLQCSQMLERQRINPMIPGRAVATKFYRRLVGLRNGDLRG